MEDHSKRLTYVVPCPTRRVSLSLHRRILTLAFGPQTATKRPTIQHTGILPLQKLGVS